MTEHRTLKEGGGVDLFGDGTALQRIKMGGPGGVWGGGGGSSFADAETLLKKDQKKQNPRGERHSGGGFETSVESVVSQLGRGRKGKKREGKALGVTSEALNKIGRGGGGGYIGGGGIGNKKEKMYHSTKADQKADAQSLIFFTGRSSELGSLGREDKNRRGSKGGGKGRTMTAIRMEPP